MDGQNVKWVLPYLKNLNLSEPISPKTPDFKVYQKDLKFCFTDNLKKNKNEERCSDDFSHFDFEVSNIETSLPPVVVLYSEEYGRYIQASRDIDAGETIFWEPPLVLSPKGGSGPTCLDCFLSFSDSNWPVCERCKCPKCKDCDGNEHSELECKILADAFKNSDISNNLNLVKRLNIILTPLRTYLVIKEASENEIIVNSLQSNVVERRNSTIGEFIDKFITNFFQKETYLNVDPEFIHHACGVFDTNAFEVTLDNQKQARALLPLAALMNHSCIPNTQHWFLFGYLVVRACVSIKKGEIITNSYTQTLWDTKTRINHLALTKLFKCKCKRCQDPSEMGSNLSFIRCQHCKEGFLIIYASKNKPCNLCGKSMLKSSAMNIINIASAVVTSAENMETEIIYKTINKLDNMIGLQHFTAVKLQFIYLKKMVGEHRKTSFNDLVKTFPIIERLLLLVAKIKPGLTKTKGVLLYYKLSIMTELLSRFEKGNDEDKNEDQLSATLSKEDMEKLFDECETILKWDSLLKNIQETRESWKAIKGANQNSN